MENKAPKVGSTSWVFFIGSAIVLLITVYILVTSLINTTNKNSVKGEIDSKNLVAAASDNLKPIWASSTSDAPVADAPVKVEELKAEPVAEQKMEEKPSVTEVAAATAAVVETANAAPSAKTLEKGKAVYSKSCFACHATGVAGSPKLDDKAAWAPRIATGMEALYAASLNGKGAMPSKGGNMSLSDEDVKAAVDYMVSVAK